MKVVGETENREFLILKKGVSEQELFLYDPGGNVTLRPSDLLLKRPFTKSIRQASFQQLCSSASKTQSLLAIVYEEEVDDATSNFTATLFLLENFVQNFKDSPNQEKFASIVILEEVPLVKDQKNELQVHILPPNPPEPEASFPLGPDTPLVPTPIDGFPELVHFRNRVIALSLGECIATYEIETTLSSAAGAKIEIINSDIVPKSFSWSQWIPDLKFLAFIHLNKTQPSSIEEDFNRASKLKPILSVFQFHEKLPREAVVNFPLEDGDTNVLSNETQKLEEIIRFTSTPTELWRADYYRNFKILAHADGSVFLFQLITPRDDKNGDEGVKFSYKVNALHHNKTLNVNVQLVNKKPVVVDVCLFQNGQFVAVVGYPHFLHLLDIGNGHDPSHHIILDWFSLPISKFVKSFRRIVNMPNKNGFKNPYSLIFINDEISKVELEINSGLLVPLFLQSKYPDLNFSIAVTHYLIIHMSDINAAKKIIYEIGRSLSSPHLTEVFQEFLIANSFLSTKKQLMPNMKVFLNFLPYSSLMISKSSNIRTKNANLELIQNSATVSTILLSPSQRILPHGVTDVWTQLWNISKLLSQSTRFCHWTVAQKLILSLQCYQPEALSRATTPMSPSSPMVCNSLGDIAALFGRRGSELQLPFFEHESCTANKQEYVYSINLRELSTHLLKERRDWPLHGQTVAGKYMNALVESGRLLCHLICLALHLQLNKTCKTKGLTLIDTLTWEVRMKLFLLFEHISLALGTLACPLPQGFTPFFAYLGYRVLKYDQFLWHVRSGTFDLQIDLVKAIMADMNDSEEENIAKKLHLISLLPKSRGCRVLNGWSHSNAICIRARQHSSDLLSGVTSVAKKSTFNTMNSKVRLKCGQRKSMSPLDSFLHLLTAKAHANDIDLGLLTEATMLSMQMNI